MFSDTFLRKEIIFKKKSKKKTITTKNMYNIKTKSMGS